MKSWMASASTTRLDSRASRWTRKHSLCSARIRRATGWPYSIGFYSSKRIPARLRSFRSYKPLHVVNMALNLVAGKNLAWQQRKAESFTSSPLHSGCYCIDDPDQNACGSYRRSTRIRRRWRNLDRHRGSDFRRGGEPEYGISLIGGDHLSTDDVQCADGMVARQSGTTGQKTLITEAARSSRYGPLLAEGFGLTDDKTSTSICRMAVTLKTWRL